MASSRCPPLAPLQQGWPRFIQRMMHGTPDGGVAISLLGPATGTLPNGAVVAMTGEYPFEDDVTITLTKMPAGGMPVYIRIPAWATAATIAVNGGAAMPVGAGAVNTMYRVPGVAAATATVVLHTNPAIRVDAWYNGALAVHRGALVYSLQLDETLTVIARHGLSANDYNVTQPKNTTISWNSALVVDPANPGATLTFERRGAVPAVPYAAHESSVVIHGTARSVAAWGFAADGSAAPPPASPVNCAAAGACGAPKAVLLVPFGTTHLRMTQLPYTSA